jgi:hypothetical protein
MFFVNWKSSFDLVLKEHIEQKISYGKYLSPLAQNEFIHCCELEIKSKIVRTVVYCFCQELSGDTRYWNGVQDDLSFLLMRLPVLVRYGNTFVVSWIFTGVILKGP